MERRLIVGIPAVGLLASCSSPTVHTSPTVPTSILVESVPATTQVVASSTTPATTSIPNVTLLRATKCPTQPFETPPQSDTSVDENQGLLRQDQHTPAETTAARAVIDVEASANPSVFLSYGTTFGNVTTVSLTSGQNALAARLIEQLGDLLSIDVGGIPFVPEGCGPKSVPPK